MLVINQVSLHMEMLITVLLTHVTHSPHPASNEFSFRHFDGQPQVRNTDVSCSKAVTIMKGWNLLLIIFHIGLD